MAPCDVHAATCHLLHESTHLTSPFIRLLCVLLLRFSIFLSKEMQQFKYKHIRDSASVNQAMFHFQVKINYSYTT